MGDGEDKGSGEGEGDARDEVSAGSSSVPRKAAGGRAVGTASTMASAMVGPAGRRGSPGDARRRPARETAGGKGSSRGGRTTPRWQPVKLSGAENDGHAAYRYVHTDIK